MREIDNKLKNKWLLFLILIFVFIMSGCNPKSESSAKKDIESYLEYMKTGDTDKAKNYLDNTDSLIDVFDYKYLKTLEDKDVQVITTVSKDDFINSDVYKKKYRRYPYYVEHIKKTFGNDKNYVVKEDTNSITYYKKGEKIKKYVLLYDTTIANNLGNKLYKKIEFHLEWKKSRYKGDGFEEGFVITDFNIRGSED
jgi:hypothetical protein